MATKRKIDSASSSLVVTAERAVRLHHLLRLLSNGPKPRAFLQKSVGLDLRGFYRDLGFLRSAGIEVRLEGRLYSLVGEFKTVSDRLPFPDPQLTLGEAMQLAKGKSKAQNKLKKLIARISS